jgi:hypothetical protein
MTPDEKMQAEYMVERNAMIKQEDEEFQELVQQLAQGEILDRKDTDNTAPHDQGPLEIIETMPEHESIKVSWAAVEGAIGYNVYTGADLGRMYAAKHRALRRAFNKRKRQARARTGRR